MKVVVTGAEWPLGAAVLRALVDDRKVKEVVAVGFEPPAVAGAKLQIRIADVGTQDPAGRDADIGCTGRGARIRRPGGADPGCEIVTGQVVGPRTHRRTVRSLRSGPVVWDEDAADAIVAATRCGAIGTFEVVAGDGERARRELGWKPRCPTAADVVRRWEELAPRRRDPRIAVFFRLAGWFAGRQDLGAEARSVRARVHLELTGPSGGDWTVDLDGGRARVSPGILRPPTSSLTLPAETFLDLLAGRTDVPTAQFTGRVVVRGEGHAAMVLGGMVSLLRTAREAPGLSGSLTRGLARWMEAR